MKFNTSIHEFDKKSLDTLVDSLYEERKEIVQKIHNLEKLREKIVNSRIKYIGKWLLERSKDFGKRYIKQDFH